MPKVHAKLLNDTILEEVDSPPNNNKFDESSFQSSIMNVNPGQDKQLRERAMAKISKRMVKDFAENKKKSLSSSYHSFTNQQQQTQQPPQLYSQVENTGQRLKEEYLDKTVYKITKNRSPQRVQQANLNDESIANSDANNLSVQFDQIAVDKKPVKEMLN